MPGYLMPGDAKKIANHLGEEFSDEFLKKYFQASDGPRVMQRTATGNHVFHIPTLVPKLTDTGCVFLENGRCKVHPVAPAGCSYHDMYMNAQQGEERSTYFLTCIVSGHQKNSQYTQHIAMLADAGCIAPPLLERRKKFEDSILEFERNQRADNDKA
jgi:Fe-S-cluster containining protein